MDTETTGLSNEDELIEMSLGLVEVDPKAGRIVGLLDHFWEMREPAVPITPQAQKIHGITMDEVRGKSLNMQRVKAIFTRAEVIVAHNASFDKRFVKKVHPLAAKKTWVCSMNGIEWRAKGFTSRSLHRLADHHVLGSSKAHRADHDVQTLMTLLQCPDPSTGRPYLAELLEDHAS